MAIEKVREYFESFGAAARIREFDVSSATVELAAQALGCAPERIAKTLSFLVDGGCALVVAAGDAKVDNPRSPPAKWRRWWATLWAAYAPLLSTRA